MKQVINQFRRIFSDNGSGDKDFSDQEQRLLQALDHLRSCTDNLSKAAQILSDVIKARA